MEYVNLENYASRMLDIVRNDEGLRPRRLEAERSRLAEEMHRILKPSIRRLASRKNMGRDIQDDIDQHALIAIHRAIRDWDPGIATFSTHVHWKFRAELQTLQHFEFPDRRRLATPQRISFLELDRPCRAEDGDSATMADFLVDAHAEDGVEASAREHMARHACERVFSHVVARHMQAYCVNQRDPQKIAQRRHGLMRNRWIYVRRTLHMETYEQIAQEYNLTRERTRQIIVGLDKEIRGQLPRFCKESGKVVAATRMPPADIHPSWDFMLADFHDATGIDSRIMNRDVPLPPRVDEYDFRPSVRIQAQSPMEMVEEIRRPVEEAEKPAAPMGDGRIRIAAEEVGDLAVNDNAAPSRSARIPRIRHLGVAAMAGAMLSTAVAASAQSRAIPPTTEARIEAAVGTAAAPAATPRMQARTAPVRMRRIGVPEIDRILVRRPAWGVVVADFDSRRKAEVGQAAARRDWTWLRGLRAAYVPPASGRSHALAFGPLTERQAAGMCHEARRGDRPCAVVRFGATREASRPTRNPGA